MPSRRRRNTAVAAETAASEPNVCPNADPNIDPNADPNIDPNADPNSDRILIHGASRWPLGSHAIARRRKPGLRAIHPCSLLLIRPRAGPGLRRPVDRRQLRLRQREPRQDFTFHIEEDYAVRGAKPRRSRETLGQSSEQSAKVIEFPRSAAIPVFHPSDLADPVFEP